MRTIKMMWLMALAFSVSGLANAKSPVNKTLFGGAAIKGYDTVSYFTAGTPAKGSKKFQHDYKDAVWRFASKENLELFKADPEKYAPQYGGYCAWAVAQGDTAGIDPDSWRIVDGKLYLNFNKEIQAKWEKDRSELIKKADENWPGVLE